MAWSKNQANITYTSTLPLIFFVMKKKVKDIDINVEPITGNGCIVYAALDTKLHVRQSVHPFNKWKSVEVDLASACIKYGCRINFIALSG